MTGIRNRAKFAAVLSAAALESLAGSARADLAISSAPTSNVSCSGGVCAATAQNAVLNAGDLVLMLAGGDVTVSSGSAADDIEIDAALNWTNASELTLDSYRSIAFNKPVIVKGTSAALTITTNDGGTGGDFHFYGKGHVEIRSRNALVINGNTYALATSAHKIAKMVKDGVRFIALAKSINAAGTNYTASPIPNIYGTLEGLGNTISNLSMTSSRHGIALIGILGTNLEPGTIRDLGIESTNVTYTGFSGDVGVLVGIEGFGVIEGCYATGQVASTASGTNMNTIGGLIGAVGYDASVVDSHADVTVSSAGAGDIVGGLVGLATSCGGDCTGLVNQSYATGSVIGGDGASVGGLVGDNDGGVISNSYARGAVAGGSGAFIGGLIGNSSDNPNEQSIPKVTASYSTGAVSGGSGALIGGVIGQDAADAANVDVYWDLDASGVSDPTRGAGNISNDPGLKGLTTSQFQSGLPAGFTRAIWREKTSINSGYPYLRDLPPK